ncbi:uncharacterized protein LOC119330718 isoform X2 [Triticum dicoccoides]|uniref:uncharacterized protein LOC119330718 isoform X2 n=1 Tax=Triticum dicoccoides TaxID=85692 RepID=UPI0018917008|nr:uncharacterized protein LOC119330718 isoform X2 [Triticum dicoccoides]
MHPNTVQDTPMGVHVWPIGMLLWGCAGEGCIVFSLFHYSHRASHLSSAHGAATANLHYDAPATEATSGALVLFHYGGQTTRIRVIFHSGGQISSSLGNTRSAEDAVLAHGSGRGKSFSSLFVRPVELQASLSVTEQEI